MRVKLPLVIGVACLLSVSSAAPAQTVLFDFEDGPQDWGSFGAITTDKGFIDGSVGAGRFHSADFSITDEGNFGIVDVSPPGQNLAPYGGLAVDARFVDVPGFDPFVGVRELDIIVATGTDENEEEFFAPKQTMTEEYQTFSAAFSEFKSAVDQQPPTLAELSNIRIKLVVLNTNGTGNARFDYDQVTGLAPTDADFDDDLDVDGADFLIWQRNLGSTTPNTPGDADGSGAVDAADLAIWQGKFGAAPSPAAVPEPAGGLIMLMAGAMIAARRRATRRQP